MSHDEWLKSPHMDTSAIEKYAKERIEFCEACLKRKLTLDEKSVLENTVWNTVNYITGYR